MTHVAYPPPSAVARVQHGRPTAIHIQLAFAAVVVLLLAVNAGGPLRWLYPVAAVAIGIRLLAASTADYVGFVIWIWALSPLVRRIADSQAGWQDASLVLLTPYLVTSICFVQVAARALVLPATFRVQRLPGRTMFLLSALGVACSVPLGFAARNGGAALETLNWIVPLGFACYLAACRDEVRQLERAVVTTLARVATVTGAYGVYQFFSLPDWDAIWMLNSGMRSIGYAEAFAVRVFSTMHSPGVLGYFIVAPLVLWLARPSAGGLATVCLASIVLLLSQVRTAWLGFAVSAMLVLPAVKLATGLRVVVLVLLGALCITPFLQVPEVSDRVTRRLETLGDLPAYDQSALSRLDGHVRVMKFVSAHPFGAGIGASPPEIEESVGMRDSIAIAGLVQFGIVGTLLYGAGLCLLTVRLIQYYRQAPTADALGLACVGLGMLCTAGLGIPHAGHVGVLLWLIGALATDSTAGDRSSAPSREPMSGGVVGGGR